MWADVIYATSKPGKNVMRDLLCAVFPVRMSAGKELQSGRTGIKGSQTSMSLIERMTPREARNELCWVKSQRV